MSIPRPEYPRPQFIRERWLCLNGEWEFEIDQADSGLERGLLNRPFSHRITVPFCPESVLSGIGNTDFLEAVWYRRRVRIPDEWQQQIVIVHFQAIDYDATVWVNGVQVGVHRGGFTSFSCELHDLARAGDEIEIVVRARDYHLLPQPRGKQSQRYLNYECFYTRTTGIWQTVWLEAVPSSYLQRAQIRPDIKNGCFYISQPVANKRPGLGIRATLGDTKQPLCMVESRSDCDMESFLTLTIPAADRRYWSPRDPYLYDLEIELIDANGVSVDKIRSYAGLRGITIDKKAIRINGEAIFQRLVLDQGYYPDGIMTAPSEEALVEDIEISLAAGFNGARLHQKVFEERFLYHADRLGYLCWGEFGDWGCRRQWPNDHEQYHGISYVTQWTEAVQRDFSHPCIVGWCPLNETFQEAHDGITELDDAAHALYLTTKLIDPTRPVLDASGYLHRVAATDVLDCHDYVQDPEVFRSNHEGLSEGHPFFNGPADRPWSIHYRGQPFWVSEFGGIWWSESNQVPANSWGYGDRPRNREEFYQRFAALCDVLLDNPDMFGYCYTQLTDVYQEENGLYTFDRRSKFDLDRIKAIQSRISALEIRYPPILFESG